MFSSVSMTLEFEIILFSPKYVINDSSVHEHLNYNLLKISIKIKINAFNIMHTYMVPSLG